eukprot:snap_masked-scaffold28_size608977-processed-gene-5.7 protein:Tk05758 transcript:snap_masked-scaffold28_size608977-processed-gene-5.7-mRNA-1 annotation:"high affinity copper uptake protein 1"
MDMDHAHHDHAHHADPGNMDHSGHPMHHHAHVDPSAMSDDPSAEPIMDHSAMGHHMMAMFFHGGFQEVILFDWWRINSVGGLIGSMIICFLFGIIYEGLKFVREYIISHNYTRTEPIVEESVIEQVPENGTDPAKTVKKRSIRAWIKTVETNTISKVHFLQTLLHGVQMLLAYFLMLIFMTYNSWLCAAVILGAMLGYFLFGWRKTAMGDELLRPLMMVEVVCAGY